MLLSVWFVCLLLIVIVVVILFIYVRYVLYIDDGGDGGDGGDGVIIYGFAVVVMEWYSFSLLRRISSIS